MAAPLSRVDAALDGALLWGVELDPRYRVLATTLELAGDHDPRGPVEDRRVQLLLYPVAEFVASLRHVDEAGQLRLETFETAQLPDVVERLGGPPVTAPLFDQVRQAPEEWGPQPSLRGASNAPNGRAHTFRVDVEGAEGRQLGLFATFDEARLRDPAGEDLLAATA